MTKSVIKGVKRSKTHRRKNKLMRRGPYIMKGTCGGNEPTKSYLRRPHRHYFSGYIDHRQEYHPSTFHYPVEDGYRNPLQAELDAIRESTTFLRTYTSQSIQSIFTEESPQDQDTYLPQ